MEFPIFGFAVVFLLLGTTQGFTEEEVIENLEQFSYQVSLRNAADNTHFCSGSILSKHHVLTAAHCVLGPAKKRSNTEIKVVAAQLNLPVTDESVVKNVAKIIVHPKYRNATASENDIAILILRDPLDLENNPYVSSVNLRSTETMANCYVSGWGAANYQAQFETFAYTEVEIISRPECQEFFGQQNVKISNNVVCTKSKEEICKGDSGGPLLCGGVLAGVTSSCGDFGKPGVHTNLGNSRKWINKITNRGKY